MCSPVGHGLAVWAVFAKRSRSLHLKQILWIPAMWTLSVLPDFDFIPGIVTGHPNLYHHGSMHSITFCFGIAGLITAVLSVARKENALKIGGLVLVVLVSHLILDVFSKDQVQPYGLKAFWPFSNRYVISPITLFLDVDRGSDNRTFWLGLFTLHNAKTVLVELLILSPVSLWVWFRNRIRNGDSRS
jgi:membrane-bound metal-dependent hydrolase YbcI (DUF457 family)